ncbi:MAG: 23S rRNA (uracil(1939)-C(5))-methyltransferase RlmD [Faunusvirus sp.]|jgi:tRNA/tmRNA/rRNA uracil-C5-methylase (TrmA/RlmC/RlmD family)|uniref:23S rRNA (Uracil(1939)-C(5))-methyltransferase RlmD n=1 Tax=Faunusvirus sp. TaxID=2487766 RepID=A0A3G4ZZM7_9VIRU|nr:MAG: 23S rRNA (uracil(1939)-C(5))-methyltransferase RlmD [Faunusvirus sp.]
MLSQQSESQYDVSNFKSCDILISPTQQHYRTRTTVNLYSFSNKSTISEYTDTITVKKIIIAVNQLIRWINAHHDVIPLKCWTSVTVRINLYDQLSMKVQFCDASRYAKILHTLDKSIFEALYSQFYKIESFYYVLDTKHRDNPSQQKLLFGNNYFVDVIKHGVEYLRYYTNISSFYQTNSDLRTDVYEYIYGCLKHSDSYGSRKLLLLGGEIYYYSILLGNLYRSTYYNFAHNATILGLTNCKWIMNTVDMNGKMHNADFEFVDYTAASTHKLISQYFTSGAKTDIVVNIGRNGLPTQLLQIIEKYSNYIGKIIYIGCDGTRSLTDISKLTEFDKINYSMYDMFPGTLRTLGAQSTSANLHLFYLTQIYNPDKPINIIPSRSMFDKLYNTIF